MGSKVVTIEPDYPSINGFPYSYLPKTPIQVIFTWSRPKLGRGKRNQTVTHCVFRSGVRVIGQGYTIENPNDERNDIEGIHWAFKRAIKTMIRHIEYTKATQFNYKTKKKVDKLFRQALWEAMNK